VRLRLAPMRTLLALLQTASMRLPMRLQFVPARRTERFSMAPLRLARTQLVLAQLQVVVAQLRFALGLTRFALSGLRLVCTGRCGLAFRLGSLRQSKVP
jgi:hypothetical protein